MYKIDRRGGVQKSYTRKLPQKLLEEGKNDLKKIKQVKDTLQACNFFLSLSWF